MGTISSPHHQGIEPPSRLPSKQLQNGNEDLGVCLFLHIVTAVKRSHRECGAIYGDYVEKLHAID